jgi:hypothetical protein
MMANDQGNPSSGDSKKENNKDSGGYKKGRYNKANHPVPKTVKFEGKCDELKGNIYDCSHARQADQFTKTTKEIAEYVGRTYKHGGDVRLAVMNMEVPIIPMPNDPPEGATETQRVIWKKRIEQYLARKDKLEENMKTLYSLIWGQCSDIMRQKIEAAESYTTMSATANSIELLKAIKITAFNFQSQKYLPHALHEAKKTFYLLYQVHHMSTQAYLEQFQNTVHVIEHTGGIIGIEPGMAKAYNKKAGRNENHVLTEAEQEIVQGQYLATALILSADRNRYGKLVENLENDVLQGRNVYPETLTAAYNLLTNWKQDPRNQLCGVGATNNGVSI